MVVDGHCERALGRVLTDHIVLEEFLDLGGLGQLVEFHVAVLGEFFLDDLVAQVDALVADVHAGTGDELFDLLLTLSAEGALQQIATVSDSCHRVLYLLPRCCLAAGGRRRHRIGDDGAVAARTIMRATNTVLERARHECSPSRRYPRTPVTSTAWAKCRENVVRSAARDTPDGSTAPHGCR